VYRIVREYIMFHLESISDTCIIVCSCEISYVNSPKKSDLAISILYSITDKGLPCYSVIEVTTICFLWLTTVIASFIGLSLSPNIVDKYNIDPSDFTSLIIFAWGLIVSAYKLIRVDNWAWYDFMRCRFYVTNIKQEHISMIKIPELIRIINDDKEHFSTLFNLTKNCFLLGQKYGRNCLELDITTAQLREAGMLTYTDGVYSLILDPLSSDDDKLHFYKYEYTGNGNYQIDRKPCGIVQPLRLLYDNCRVSSKIVNDINFKQIIP
jgi:hypothetical protein